MAIPAGVAYIDVEGRFDRLRQGIQREGTFAADSLAKTINKSVDAVGQGFQRSGRTLTRYVTAPILALGGLIAATGVEYNALEQRARAAFAAILGDGEKANRMMDDLREFAKTSPFPRQAFIQAAQGMLAFGFAAEDVIPTLAVIQDAVAAIGGSDQDILEIADIFNRITSQGKITGDELNRLAIRGIDAAKMIADFMGIPIEEVRKQVSAGKVDTETALTAITTGIKTLFGGAAENVKKTWTGVVDRISGAWRDLSSALAAPFVDPEGGGLAIDWANSIADRIRSIEAAVKKMSPETVTLFAGIAAAAALAGPALIVVGVALSGIATLFTPGGFILAGVAALAAGFIAASGEGENFFEKIIDVAGRARDAIGEFVTSFTTDIRPMFEDAVGLLDSWTFSLEGTAEGFLSLGYNASQATGIIMAGFAAATGVLESFKLSLAIVTGNEEAAANARAAIHEADLLRNQAMRQSNESYTEWHARQQLTQQGSIAETSDTHHRAAERHRREDGLVRASTDRNTNFLLAAGRAQRADMEATVGQIVTTRGNFIDLGRSIDRIPASAMTTVSAPGATEAKRQLSEVGDAVKRIGNSVSVVKTAINMSFEARKGLKDGPGLGARFNMSASRLPLPAGAGDGFGVGRNAPPVSIGGRIALQVTKQIEKLLALTGGGFISGGVAKMMAALRAVFPGLRLISGYRPGAITATGNRSYHGMNRAVDVPPRMDVFNWIRSTFGRNIKELIFSPAGGRQIHNGRNHLYSGVTRANHWDHVHFALDQGGTLRPGWSAVYNGLQKPEPLSRTDDLGPKLDEVSRLLRDVRERLPQNIVLDGNRVSETLRRREVARA